MASGIYEIVNTGNGKRYVGSAVILSQRWYLHRKLLERGTHHSRHLQSAWIQYGADVFVPRTLILCSREHLLMYEQIAMDALLPQYNVVKTAGSVLGMKHSEESIARMRGRLFSDETRKRISAALVGKPCSEETRRRIGAANAGRKPSLDTREKMRSARSGKKPSLGMKHSAETRRAQSERMKANPPMLGKTHSSVTRKKISEAKKGMPGHPQSLELKKKLREANLGNKVWLGRKHSEESIAKMAKAQTGRTVSPETRRLMSIAHSGVQLSDETKKRMSQAHQGRVCSEAFKQAVRDGCARRKGRLAEEK